MVGIWRFLSFSPEAGKKLRHAWSLTGNLPPLWVERASASGWLFHTPIFGKGELRCPRHVRLAAGAARDRGGPGLRCLRGIRGRSGPGPAASPRHRPRWRRPPPRLLPQASRSQRPWSISPPTPAHPPPRPRPTPRTTIFEEINKGGTIAYIILMMSFVMLSLVIEHIVSIRQDKACPPDLVNELRDYFKDNQYKRPSNSATSKRTCSTSVVRAGLSRLDAGYDRCRRPCRRPAKRHPSSCSRR